MQAEADAAIARRTARGPGPVPDLLDRLLDAEDGETGRRMDAATLRENLLTFIVAGHETTALTLSWALYLCAYDPDVQDALRREATDTLGDRAAGAGDIGGLPLTRAVIEEALRLYPPGAFLSRTAQATDRLSAAVIRPGDTVMIPVWALHRHRRLWDAPDAFRPGRWLEGPRPDRWQYLPFGDGPRICIGMRFCPAGGHDHSRDASGAVPPHAGSGTRAETGDDPDDPSRGRRVAETSNGSEPVTPRGLR